MYIQCRDRNGFPFYRSTEILLIKETTYVLVNLHYHSGVSDICINRVKVNQGYVLHIHSWGSTLFRWQLIKWLSHLFYKLKSRSVYFFSTTRLYLFWTLLNPSSFCSRLLYIGSGGVISVSLSLTKVCTNYKAWRNRTVGILRVPSLHDCLSAHFHWPLEHPAFGNFWYACFYYKGKQDRIDPTLESLEGLNINVVRFR
jgi:hypothetical protein